MTDSVLWGSELHEELTRVSRRVLELVGDDNAEVTIGGGREDLTRFANSGIHQNVSSTRLVLRLRLVSKGRTGIATTNRFDDASLEKLIRAARRSLASAPPGQDGVGLLGPQDYRQVDAFDASTAKCPPAERAESALRVVEAGRKKDLEAFGYVSTGWGTYTGYNETYPLCVENSQGLTAFYLPSRAAVEVTMAAADSSGWSARHGHALGDVADEDVARRAAEKAVASSSPDSVSPGSYTVILEPLALAEILPFLVDLGFSGLQVAEGRSRLSDKMGQKLFGSNINLGDDPYHPGNLGCPFDGEGYPTRAVSLLEDGVVSGFLHDRESARRMNQEPTGHGLPQPNNLGPRGRNLVLEGGSESLEEMIASVDRGILVSRLWYANPVDPRRIVITGMTRDGTFWIENGRITKGLKNFRFNQDLVEMLNRVETLGRSEKVPGAVLPPLLLRDFNLSSGTGF